MPRLTPLQHCLDLLRLIIPNLMSKFTDPWRTDIENELAHQQCALVVQDHGVDEAKVVGLSCWSYVVLMYSMVCLSA